MTRDQILNIFYIIVSAAAAPMSETIYRAVMAYLNLGSLPLPAQISVAATAAALFFISVIVVARLFVSLRPIRQLIAPEAMLEGVWVQRISRENRPKSVVAISFDWMTYKWEYKGWSVPESRDRLPQASWEASAFLFKGGKFYFDATAQIRQEENPNDPIRYANVVGVLQRVGKKDHNTLEGNAVDFALPRGEEVFRIEVMKKVRDDKASLHQVDTDGAFRYDLAKDADV